jgi:hypothetical protein
VSQIAYLFDEHTPSSIAGALLSMEPAVVVLAVGQPGAPPKRTPDPDLLEFAYAQGLVILSFDKRTMPGHIRDRLASGNHIAGVILVPNDRLDPKKVAEDLLLAWSATDRDYWIDRVEYLPF